MLAGIKLRKSLMKVKDQSWSPKEIVRCVGEKAGLPAVFRAMMAREILRISIAHVLNL